MEEASSKKGPMQRLFTGILVLVFLGAWGAGESWGLVSPHPLKIYEEGSALLDSYRGDRRDLRQAQDHFMHLIKKYPESPFGYLGMSRSYIIEAYRHGNHYDMTAIKDEALPFAIKALELGSSLRAVHENYAMFEKIFEQQSQNQRQAKHSLTLYPQSPETYMLLGHFVMDQGDYEQALEYFQVALAFEPDTSLQAKLWKRIAWIHFYIYDDAEKAMQCYQKALDVDGDSAILHEYLGRAYLRLEKYDEAISAFRKSLDVLSLNSTQYNYHKAQGLKFRRDGNVEEAARALRQALQTGKADSFVHYSLGDLYFKQGNYAGAHEQFRKSIELKPEDPDAYFYAGRSADSLGEPDLAMDYYRQYLKLDNTSRQAEWILNHVPAVSQK